MNEKPSSRSHVFIQRAAILVLMGWLALHATWRILDRTPPRGDQTFYINGAVRALDLPTRPPLQGILALNDLTSTALRPPVASMALALWLWLFDNNLRLAGWGAVVWHGGTFLLLYLLGKRWFDSTTGLMAGVFFISLPLIYDAYIDPEFYFMTLLPLALLCCARLWDESRHRWLGWLAMGMVASLGLLCKWVFAVYLLGPMVFLSADLIRRIRQPNGSFKTRRFVIEAGVMVLPVLPAFVWYGYNWTALADAFQSISEARQFTPFKGEWAWQVLFHYPNEWIAHNKLFPLLFLIPGIVLPLIPGKCQSKMIRIQNLETNGRQGYFLLMSSVVGSWIYFSIRYDNIPIKYILALQPVLALLGVGWIRMLSNASLRGTLYASLLVLGFLTSFWMHFAPWPGIESSDLPRSDIFPRDYALLRYTVPVPRIPQTEDWPQESIAESIIQLERDFPILPDKNEAIKPVLVLPDLYFFDWRSCGTAFNLKGLELEAMAVPDLTGLLRLAAARYIVTSRGQCTRFSEENRDEMLRNAIALNRLIDRAPQWFWNNFRMVGRFAMPYELPELQLFRRVKPIDEAEAIGWCEFWISHHRDEPNAWEQVSKIWAMQRNQTRRARALTIQALRSNSRIDRGISLSELQADPDLLPYELLELGETPLRQCADSHALCAWRAAWELGKQFLERNQFESAQEYLLKAWRLERERPEILESLCELAKRKKDAQLEDLARQLVGVTHSLLANNRRPILYQNAANLLLSVGWNSDALWYAFQGFVVGLNRYPNTIPLHNALQRMNRSFPDYETIPLPFNQWSENLDWYAPQIIHREQGESYLFPFLNLDGGTYRLRWNHALKTPSVTFLFTLDEHPLESKTFNTAAEPETGEWIFQSPRWGDRLRIECEQGEADLSQIELQRIETEIPFLDWDGTLNVQGKNYHSGQYDPDKGFSFVPVSDWVRLNFNLHTDPRAWDDLLVKAIGLDTQSATFTVIVRGDGKTDEEFNFSHPLITDPIQGFAVVPIPPEIKRYPFMLGIRVQFNKLTAAGQRSILRMALRRR